MFPNRATLPMSLLITLAVVAPALAQPYPGGWADRRGPWQDRVMTQGNAEPSTRIDVETFRAADAGAMLGKGRIVVVDTAKPQPTPDPDAQAAAPMPGFVAPLPGSNDTPPDLDGKLPVYEAAVIDQLARKGYDVADAANPQQLVEIAISHDVVVPEEAPHRPVSGEVSIGVSNRGFGYGGAIAIDLTKPRKAIMATRLDVRIRDKVTARVLWEGYAQGQSRLSESGLDNGRIAARLSGALFARFPDGKVVQALPGTSAAGGVE